MKKSIAVSVCLLSFLLTPIVQAEEAIENDALARVQKVLDSLTPLINQAEQQKDTQAREQFNYDALREDINKVKQGINEKLQNVPIQPRTVTPLQEDYLQLKSKHL